jgi:hypothetical protein
MTRLEARINLRLSQDVYDVYARVGEKFNTSVTEMVREMVNDGVEVMQSIAVIIEAAEGGDKEASAQLLDLFMQSNDRRLELAKAVMRQEMKGLTAEGQEAGRASNTSR